MRKKSIMPWIFLLVLPIPLLVMNAIFHYFVRTTLTIKNTAVTNSISLLIGVVAVIALLGIPIWIIMIIKIENFNNHNATASVLDKNALEALPKAAKSPTSEE